VAELIEVTCDCGYRTTVADGGLFAGVTELFVCRDCREVVSVLVWSSGIGADAPPGGPVDPTCGQCGGTNVQAWREGENRTGVCPRCAAPLDVTSVGLAD